MRNIRRQEVENRSKMRRLIIYTVGILLFIYLTLSLIFGENGLLRYMRLKSVKADILTEMSAVKKQNNDIKGQIKDLKEDPALIEELAREQGLTKEGEWVFKDEQQ